MKRSAITLFLAVVVYSGVSFFADIDKLWKILAAFPMKIFLWACLLTCGNYFFRFLKWHFYLKHLKISVPWQRSLGVFLSGFVMSVTPGKIGEVLKAYLLKCSDNIPITKTASVVVVERVTDLIGVLFLALIGVASFSAAGFVVVAGGALVLIFLVVLSSERLCFGMLGLIARLPKMERVSEKMKSFYQSMKSLVKPWPLLVGCVLSFLGWSLEALAFFFLLRGFPVVQTDLFTAFMIYSVSTTAGALSFLPGGLGVTEGGMIALVLETVKGATRTIAVAATILIRLATLWFAVILGFLTMGWMRWRVGKSFWRLNTLR